MTKSINFKENAEAILNSNEDINLAPMARFMGVSNQIINKLGGEALAKNEVLDKLAMAVYMIGQKTKEISDTRDYVDGMKYLSALPAIEGFETLEWLCSGIEFDGIESKFSDEYMSSLSGTYGVDLLVVLHAYRTNLMLLVKELDSLADFISGTLDLSDSKEKALYDTRADANQSTMITIVGIWKKVLEVNV